MKTRIKIFYMRAAYILIVISRPLRLLLRIVPALSHRLICSHDRGSHVEAAVLKKKVKSFDFRNHRSTTRVIYRIVESKRCDKCEMKLNQTISYKGSSKNRATDIILALRQKGVKVSIQDRYR